MKIDSMPKQDNYYMPGEYRRHYGTIMIWPVRPGSWPYGAKAAKKVFAEIAGLIAKHEEVYMLTDKLHLDEAKKMLADSIHIVEMESDDAWARDVCPTFVVRDGGHDLKNNAALPETVRAINWKFNAWGGDFDGLYADWEKDNKIAKSFCEYIGCDFYDADPFVLEGGAIHSDGEGTVIVTERCLLSAGRNPSLTKVQIEEKLKNYLGAQKVIWLPYGIYQDETNEHVDNVCAFTSPAHVVLAWTDKTDDPQYEMSAANLEVLNRERDAKGRQIHVHKLHIPDRPVCITREDLNGYVFERGEDERQEGERLAASYVNFYIANQLVLLPQFGDVNDERAVRLIQELIPDRKVIGIYARDIIVGGGNIHCITQQIPM